MSAERLSQCMSEMLHILAEEVADNKRLASRLSVPWQAFMTELAVPEIKAPRKKKAPVKEPPAIDPFKTFLEGGSVLLLKSLDNLDAAQCKSLISHYALDPSRSYMRLRRQDKLVELIAQRVKAIVNKGEVFND